MDYLFLENDWNFRHNELLREAEAERLIRRVTAGKPGVQVRMLQGLGNALISLGKGLKSLSLSL